MTISRASRVVRIKKAAAATVRESFKAFSLSWTGSTTYCMAAAHMFELGYLDNPAQRS
jgi:hypothetical protein